MVEEKRLFTMTNGGKARNCSVTSVFSPPNLKLIQFQIGQPSLNTGVISPVSISHISYYLESIYNLNHPVSVILKGIEYLNIYKYLSTFNINTARDTGDERSKYTCKFNITICVTLFLKFKRGCNV